MRCVAIFPALLAGVGFLGCSSTPTAPSERTSEVKVEWHGHNCFSLKSSIGLSVVTDPFNPALVSYPKPANLNADLLLMSGEDPNASNSDLIANSAPMLRGTGGAGRTTISGIPVNGVEVPGFRVNTAYSFRLDGVRFCHLGNPERPLTQSEAQRLGPVDVLFLPVGGPKNLDVRELDATVALLAPRIVVPMGYKTNRTGALELRGVNEWLSRQTKVVRLPGRQFSVTQAGLPLQREVFVPAVP
jgi:L-ascorbate metabolism protein UlaG (beta-lactamase superfamily)